MPETPYFSHAQFDIGGHLGVACSHMTALWSSASSLTKALLQLPLSHLIENLSPGYKARVMIESMR